MDTDPKFYIVFEATLLAEHPETVNEDGDGKRLLTVNGDQTR